MNWWLQWFSRLAGGLSIFNLVRLHWGLQIMPLLKQLVDFYISLLHPPAELIAWLLSWVILIKVPADLIIFWFVVGAALIRSAPHTRLVKSIKSGKVDAVLRTLCWPWILGKNCRNYWAYYGQGPIQSPVMSMFPPITEMIKLEMKWWGVELCKVILVFFVFFALNAGMS